MFALICLVLKKDNNRDKKSAQFCCLHFGGRATKCTPLIRVGFCANIQLLAYIFIAEYSLFNLAVYSTSQSSSDSINIQSSIQSTAKRSVLEVVGSLWPELKICPVKNITKRWLAAVIFSVLHRRPCSCLTNYSRHVYFGLWRIYTRPSSHFLSLK